MVNITTDAITAYVVARQTAGAEAATINRELAILKRAFRLAVRARKLVSTPYVPMPMEERTSPPACSTRRKWPPAALLPNRCANF